MYTNVFTPRGDPPTRTNTFHPREEKGMEDPSVHDVVAALCLLVVFNSWRQHLAVFLFLCLFVSLVRSAAFLSLLCEGL